MIETQRLYVRNTILRLLQNCKNMRELKQIHSQIITSPGISKPDHYFLISRFIFFCTVSESGCVSYATQLFRLIENPNLFVYNAMIRAYATKTNEKSGPSSCRSLILYKQMLFDHVFPDCITFPFLLKECVRRGDGFAGRSIHAHVLKLGFHSDVFVQNSLVSLYSECGFLNIALRVFDEMSNRDVVSWNSIIIGCLRSGELDLALDLFRRMKGRRNIITWNSIITGFVQGGRPREAIELFHEMQIWGEDMVSPDRITVASVLSACAAVGAINYGKWMHSYLNRSGLECDMVIGTALVDMYGKCGCVERALEVFRGMPKKDVLAWTAMISVFALHGYGNETFDLFAEMEAAGLRPNPVTFVGLLSACAHAGLVEKGRWCFDMMKSVYLIEPQVQHYACMIVVLSRAGHFHEAEGLIRSMPMEPDVFVWGALLGGCQMHGNVDLGEKVAWHLIDLEPSTHAFYVNLCDIYAKVGKFDDMKKVRAFMNEKGIKKAVPGCGMIEVDGIVHEFSVRGSAEVEMEGIHCVLNWLSNEMKMEGGLVAIILVTYIKEFILEDRRPPVAGPRLNQLIHFNRLFDYLTSLAQKHSTFRLISPLHNDVYTADPVNVEYMLKTNFSNYGKGEYHCGIMRDLFGDGIFSVDGDKWRHQRKLASFEFSTKVLRDFSTAVFRTNAAKLASKVSVAALAKQTLNLQDLLMKSTLDSIFKVGFGVELNTLSGSDEWSNQFMKAFDDSNGIIFRRYVDQFWRIKRVLNIGLEATLKKNIKVIDRFVYDLIQRKREQMKRGRLDGGKEDILSRFLVESEKDSENMNAKYLRDITLSFIIAGKDTSANTLTWFFYMLCRHPLVQEKVAQEVREATEAEDNLSTDIFANRLTEAALDKMQYLHAALTETLRLYPAVPADGKSSEQDDVLPDGFKIKKGDGVIYMAYAMGRMTFIWGEDAEEFRPERWLDKGVFRPESPYKFTAFQGGPRICLGKEFAYRQMKILAAVLIFFFKFKLVDEDYEATYRTMFTLHMDKGLPLYAFPRM
ncbi:unnamed protein product [Ilex paraguariensis]|uniref:Cytochrome P450 n=1 Tax=Ilex paraguariensis TaxID=185542 RepID=A0ABC8QUK4_9AQUA